MTTRPILLRATVLAGSLALATTCFAQSNPAPAPAPAPAAGETGQPGTMGSSQPETNDKTQAPATAAPSVTPAATPASTPAAATVMVPIGNEQAPVPQLNLMVGQVGEMDVIGADGNEIGGVDNVLGDQAGTAKALSVQIGGFLGIGEKTVIFNLSDVTLDMGRLRTSLTKQQIEQLPDFSN